MTDIKKTAKPSLTVKALQTAVDTWIKTYGVRYFSEMTNLAVLMEEVGELARIISRTYGEQSFKPGSTPSDLGDEIADALVVGRRQHRDEPDEVQRRQAVDESEQAAQADRGRGDLRRGGVHDDAVTHHR